MATEGEDNGEWIIVDCGAAVVHIMQPAIREYYHLEEIWGGKPVRMKVGEVKTTLVKASEPEPARKARPAKAASPPRRHRRPDQKARGKKPPALPPPSRPASADRPPAQAVAAKAAPARKAGRRGQDCGRQDPGAQGTPAPAERP